MLPELADEPEFVTMFIDEVRLVRAIKHPNVVKIYDVGEHEGGVMWMSMEWVEGESLHTVIAEAGKRRAIPPEMAVQDHRRSRRRAARGARAPRREGRAAAAWFIATSRRTTS